MAGEARILIADDDAAYRRTISRFLTGQGYLCDEAADAAQAVEMLTAVEYDLLISDIEMPGNEDLHLVRRASEIASGLPVLLITGYPTVATAVDSHALPVFAYIVKPPDFSTLAQQVQQAIAQYRVMKAVKSTESRMTDWANDLALLRENVQSYSSDGADTHLRSYVSMTFNNMIGAMGELKTLLDITYRDEKNADICRIVDCPIKQRFESAMNSAIEALRDTKGTFKSKEIADLRRKFERMLEEERSRPSSVERRRHMDCI